MARIEDYYTDTVEVENEIKSISVFTNDEHNSKTDGDLSWVITGEDEGGRGEFIKEMSDVMGFCECSHCENSNKEIAE